MGTTDCGTIQPEMEPHLKLWGSTADLAKGIIYIFDSISSSLSTGTIVGWKTVRINYHRCVYTAERNERLTTNLLVF